jgi:sulfopyruvate decarboxylase TPP-binding subunit
MKYQETNVVISDKILHPLIKDKDYITATDEGEAIGIAGGHYLATGKKATVFMSADGFCNALNAITSWVIPEDIKMHIVISFGRTESQHYIMSELLRPILLLLSTYDSTNVSYELIAKES